MTARMIDPAVERAAGEFRTFYLALVEAKEHVARLAVAGGPAPQAIDSQQVAQRVFEPMFRLLVEFGYGQRRDLVGDVTAMEPGYVMAALADEALLHMVERPDRLNWSSMLLEEALYGTRVAGERVFAAADALTRTRANAHPALAYVILQALELGFRGRYRDADDGGMPEALRHRLYDLAFQQPYRPDVVWSRFFDVAGPDWESPGPAARMPRLQPWLLAILGLVAGYLLVSHVIWQAGVSDILERARQVIAHPATIMGL